MPRRFAPRNDNGGTSLHPPARSRVPHTLRAKHPCTRAHVLPSACHCEPVRTLVRQSASPQGNLASWQYLGRIRDTLRIRPKYCFSFCTAARSTDCRVASLLAMTCRNLPRVRIIPGHCRYTAGKPPCTRKSASSFCIPLRQTLLQPQRPYLLLHVIANQCAHWCGNPRPRRETRQVGATSGKSAAPLVFALSTALRYVLPQGVRIATSLRSSQ